MVERRWAITKLVLPFISSRHRLLNLHLGTGIDAAGRLIQNQDLRIRQERARNRQQLLLTLRDVGRLLIENGVIALRQRPDKVVGVGRFGRLDNLLFRGILASIGDIVANGSVEEPRILQHHAEHAAQSCHA